MSIIGSLATFLLFNRTVLGVFLFQVFDLKIGQEPYTLRALSSNLTAFNPWVKLIIVHLVDAETVIVQRCKDTSCVSIRDKHGGWAPHRRPWIWALTRNLSGNQWLQVWLGLWRLHLRLLFSSCAILSRCLLRRCALHTAILVSSPGTRENWSCEFVLVRLLFLLPALRWDGRWLPVKDVLEESFTVLSLRCQVSLGALASRVALSIWCHLYSERSSRVYLVLFSEKAAFRRFLVIDLLCLGTVLFLVLAFRRSSCLLRLDEQPRDNLIATTSIFARPFYINAFTRGWLVSYTDRAALISLYRFRLIWRCNLVPIFFIYHAIWADWYTHRF